MTGAAVVPATDAPPAGYRLCISNGINEKELYVEVFFGAFMESFARVGPFGGWVAATDCAEELARLLRCIDGATPDECDECDECDDLRSALEEIQLIAGQHV